ncbi:MAG TPA: MFS transporter [Rhizomicrobium sp.]|nr:MFS transporter [Rhizomicrobium sp.]
MAEQDQVFAKCAWRLLPFMMLLYVVGFIDRSNVGFAALTMNRDLGFSPPVFGFGAGIFFLGYLSFQIPATVLLARTGARRVVFCIMVAWGLISAANAFVQGAQSFYLLRFLLGVAEAGFTPCMIFYITLWFPPAWRGRVTATFCGAIPLAGIISGPLSGLILGMDGTLGLHGWQWLFLIQGLPAVLLAFAVLKYLPDNPTHADWLSAAEKDAIAARLAGEVTLEDRGLWPTLRDPRLLLLGLAGFCSACALYGVTLWLPQIVQAMGFSNRATGFVVALPYIFSIGAMIVWGRLSDASGERIRHAALTMVLAAAAFAGGSLTSNHMLVLLALTLAMAGGLSGIGPFQSFLSSFSRGTAAAGGIALVNTIATLGGFFGPVLIGLLKARTGNFAAGMAALALAQIVAALLVLAVGRATAAARP